jgi:hypothetical protein
MKHDTAGDPMTGLRWTRKTTEKVATELQRFGIQVSPRTVSRLLKDIGFSLRVNQKKASAGSGPDRNEQFEYIAGQCERFSQTGQPIISIDTKKKELVGNFKNPGAAWSQHGLEVNDHDFRSTAVGIAIPHGIYEVLKNRGSVFVGTSHDTPEFAVSNINRWWRYTGRKSYPAARQLLILADSGGSNAARSRAWKLFIQQQLCDRLGLSVTVCHYPTGASKWNPIEHRLFSEISKNWAGRPLDSYETVLNYLRTTSTSTGLTVKAYLVAKQFQNGLKVSNKEMASLNLHRHDVQPLRNYSLSPRN